MITNYTSDKTIIDEMTNTITTTRTAYGKLLHSMQMEADSLAFQLGVNPKKMIPEINRILFYNNDKTTVVYWKDGTKTSCVCDSEDEPSKYAGFCACLAKKIYGKTSRIKRIIDENDETAKRERDEAEKKRLKEKNRAEAERKKNKAHQNAVKRKMKELTIEQEALSRLEPSVIIEGETVGVSENV